jgi:hypothetical protein
VLKAIVCDSDLCLAAKAKGYLTGAVVRSRITDATPVHNMDFKKTKKLTQNHRQLLQAMLLVDLWKTQLLDIR